MASWKVPEKSSYLKIGSYRIVRGVVIAKSSSFTPSKVVINRTQKERKHVLPHPPPFAALLFRVHLFSLFLSSTTTNQQRRFFIFFIFIFSLLLLRARGTGFSRQRVERTPKRYRKKRTHQPHRPTNLLDARSLVQFCKRTHAWDY